MVSSRSKVRSAHPVSTAWLLEAMTQQHDVLARHQARKTHPFLKVAQTLPEENANDIVSNKIDETELKYLHKLDEGTFGEAYLVKWKDEIIVVKDFKLAAISMSDCDSERIMMQMLTDLRAPNMVNILGYSQSSLHYAIAMPYFENGSLANYMDRYDKPFPLRLTYRITKDFLRAIEYLHRNNIVHGDVKDTNILLDRRMRAYLTDFGMTRFLDNKVCDDINLLWRAPEALEQPYSQSTEMYSVGVVIWQLVTGKLPFEEWNDEAIVRFVAAGGRPKIPETCPTRLTKWIKKCWQHEPEKRMTATNILIELEAFLEKGKKRRLPSQSEPSVALLRKSL